MIKNVVVTNFVGEKLEMSLSNPYSSGFAILSIDGLYPPKADILTVDYANNDGAIYNGSRFESRNIVLQLKLFPLPTMEETKHKLYRYFPSKKKLTISFETNTRTVYIEGYVESANVDYFSKMTQASISIICPDPYFKDGSTGGNVDEVFYGEFPLVEFATEDYGGLEFPSAGIAFGDILNEPTKAIEYEGDIDIGVIISIKASGSATNIAFTNSTKGQTMLLDTDIIEDMTGDGIIDGDYIVIDTRSNRKSITLLRDGVLYNIINCLGLDTGWISLQNGVNIVSYQAETGYNSLKVDIQYQKLYESL